ELQPEQNVTCLVAKASLDESTRWHRRMAHVNFKTINKLAKEGLVDGLPLKVFTNEHNCVACPSSRQWSLVLSESNADNAEELAKLQRQEYEAKRLHCTIWDPAGIDSAVRDPAGIDSAITDPAGIVSADGVSTGSPSAGSDPAGVYTPPGKQLGSSENTTRFPVPSDVCMDQLSSGIFTSSSYDDDFCATLTNLARAVKRIPFPTKRVKTQFIPQSQILGESCFSSSDKKQAHKSKFERDATVHQPQYGTCILYLIGKTCNRDKMDFEKQEGCQMNRDKEHSKTVVLGFASSYGLSGISAGWLRVPCSYGEIEEEVYVTQPKALKILTSRIMYTERFKLCMDFNQAPRSLVFTIVGFSVTTQLQKRDYRQDTVHQERFQGYTFGTDGSSSMSTVGNSLPDGKFPQPRQASRPDKCFAVSACSRHQVTPLTSHLNAVKKIFKYLKGQPKLGLWYPKDSPFQLEAYSDSD
ncbi:putative ribonuclease H-like domain-containing protein, partial [Tanacetum coccineum]